MDSQPAANKQTQEDLAVEWFGIDGLLVLLFIVLSYVYGYGMVNKVDFIIGMMAPGVAILITTSVFIRYCTEVFSFASGKKKNPDKK